jgi:DnaK suppressor protein
MKMRMEHELADLLQHIKNQHEDDDQVEERETPDEEDFKETAVRMIDREIGAAIFANEYQLVTQIQQALQRIKEGTYGTCRVCGQPISEKRLHILPWADLCVKDQAEREKEHAYDTSPSAMMSGNG